MSHGEHLCSQCLLLRGLANNQSLDANVTPRNVDQFAPLVVNTVSCIDILNEQITNT